MATRESVIRYPAVEKDRFGDPTGTSRPVTIDGAIVYPRSSNEDADAANMVIDRLGMLLPVGTTVTAEDQFSVRGKRYSVEGEPYDTRRKGVLVSLAGAVQGG